MAKISNLIIILIVCLCLVLKVHSDDEEKLKLTTAKNSLSDDRNKDETFLQKRHDKHDKNSREHNSGESDDDDSEHEHGDHHDKTHKSKNKTIDLGFFHAFLASLSVIVVSEIGDKTFFIAAIMSMKHPRLTVYSGAIFALGLMTLLSALLGNILTTMIPKTYTYYASSFLFALFGLKMLREGYEMENHDASEEYEEASNTLKENEDKDETLLEKDVEANVAIEEKPAAKEIINVRAFITFFRKYFSPILLQAFILTFLAEWGDRSQISTIILGARENMAGTVLGGTIGHAICTGFAVIGGRFVAQRISVRTVTLVGAFVFLFFAFSAFFIDPNSY